MSLIIVLIAIVGLLIALSVRKSAFYRNAAASVSGLRLAVNKDSDLVRRSTFGPHKRIGHVTGVEVSKAGLNTILSFTFSDRIPYTYRVTGGMHQAIALHDQIVHYL